MMLAASAAWSSSRNTALILLPLQKDAAYMQLLF
jgi:hypothetical protein